MPHDDSDDIRMLPNLFEAFTYSYKDFFNIDHISTMAGWENGADHTQFVNVHQSFRITDTNKQNISSGITAAGLNYKNRSETFSFNIFDFYIHEAVNVIYIESSFTVNLLKNYNLTLSAQYDNYAGVDSFFMVDRNATFNDFDSTVTGFLAKLEFTKAHLTLSFATNKVSGADAPLRSLGSGPYFSSMEYNTIDGVVTNDASSVMSSLSYDASEKIKGLKLSYFYGTFESGEKSVDLVEQNFVLEYENKDYFTLTMAYTTVENAISTGTADFVLFRTFLDFPIETY